MEPTTVIELEQWLKTNCYNFDSYSINGNFIYEGFGIDNNGGLYSWYYTERGNKQTLEYFRTEKEAVQFALTKIKANAHALRHFIGMYKEAAAVEAILLELQKRDVDYFTDEIPYGGLNDKRTRIFVIGCDIEKVGDLKNENR